MEIKDKAQQIILRIIERDFKIKPEVSLANANTPLFLTPFGMDAVDLTYFLLTIQKEVEISFPVESFDGYKLLSIESITKLVNSVADWRA